MKRGTMAGVAAAKTIREEFIALARDALAKRKPLTDAELAARLAGIATELEARGHADAGALVARVGRALDGDEEARRDVEQAAARVRR